MCLAEYVAIAGDAGKSGHPRHVTDRDWVADAHEVRSMRTDADPPDGKSGEAGPIPDHHVVVFDRDGLRLRRAVDVNELRQKISRFMLGEEAFCLVRSHFIHLQRSMRYRHRPGIYFLEECDSLTLRGATERLVTAPTGMFSINIYKRRRAD